MFLGHLPDFDTHFLKPYFTIDGQPSWVEEGGEQRLTFSKKCLEFKEDVESLDFGACRGDVALLMRTYTGHIMPSSFEQTSDVQDKMGRMFKHYAKEMRESMKEMENHEKIARQTVKTLYLVAPW